MIEVGRSKLLRSRLPSPLESHEAVLPAGIVSLLVNKTVGEVMDGSPDIEATYYAYLTKLVRISYHRVHQKFDLDLTASRNKMCNKSLTTAGIRRSSPPSGRRSVASWQCLKISRDALENYDRP